MATKKDKDKPAADTPAAAPAGSGSTGLGGESPATSSSSEPPKLAKKSALVQATAGRIVFYYDREEVVEASRRSRDPQPTPAIVRRARTDAGGVELGACDLTLFTDLGPVNKDAVPAQTEPFQPGAWCWPPKVS